MCDKLTILQHMNLHPVCIHVELFHNSFNCSSWALTKIKHLQSGFSQCVIAHFLTAMECKTVMLRYDCSCCCSMHQVEWGASPK